MERYAYEIWDPFKVRLCIDELNFNITGFAEASKVNQKSLEMFLRDARQRAPLASTIDRAVEYLVKLDTKKRDRACFQRSSAVDMARESFQVAKALRIAALHGAIRVRELLAIGRAGEARKTSLSKLTDKATSDDPTLAIDKSSGDAIQSVLHVAAQNSLNPLSKGYLLIQEETPPFHFVGQDNAESCSWVVSADEDDDSAAAEKDAGGFVLLGAYHIGTAWMAAAAVDVRRWILFSRVQGAPTQVLRLSQGHDFDGLSRPELLGFEEPSGIVAGDVRPQGTRALKGASVCINLVHPDRLLLAASLGNALLSPEVGIKEIMSWGGSAGPIRVGQGLVGASVEFMKGFRVIDLIPGLMIAEGLGATVVDLHGRPFRLDLPDMQLEKILRGSPDEITKGIKGYRRKFIAAATRELAVSIVDLMDDARAVDEVDHSERKLSDDHI